MKVNINKWGEKNMTMSEKYIYHILYFYHLKFKIVLSIRDISKITETPTNRVFQILKSLEKRYLVTKIKVNCDDKRLQHYAIDENPFWMRDLIPYDHKKDAYRLYELYINPNESI